MGDILWCVAELFIEGELSPEPSVSTGADAGGLL